MEISKEKQSEIDEIYRKSKKEIDEAIKGYADTMNFEE